MNRAEFQVAVTPANATFEVGQDVPMSFTMAQQFPKIVNGKPSTLIPAGQVFAWIVTDNPLTGFQEATVVRWGDAQADLNPEQQIADGQVDLFAWGIVHWENSSGADCPPFHAGKYLWERTGAAKGVVTTKHMQAPPWGDRHQHN